jgi:hypothetical protein
MSSNILLEVLNGSAITPELLLLLILTRYLMRTSREYGLSPLDWFHLPPHMDLILAMFICDIGLFARSVITWAWRFFGEGDFNSAQAAGLIAGGLLITIGLLCKIRALTYPNDGNTPWLLATAVTIVMTVALTTLTLLSLS